MSKTSAAHKELPGVPRDFYYAGRRQGQKYMLDAIAVIQDDGTFLERLYKAERSIRVVGGRYTGARFDGTASYGLKVAKYTGNGNHVRDKALQIQWEALHEQALVNDKQEKLEKDAKRSGEIARIMEPLAQLYGAYQRRGDVHSARALRVAVDTALLRGFTRSQEA